MFFHVWVDFFVILGGFGVVWGGVLGAKRRPKLLQKLMQKMIDFWIAPKTVLGGFGTLCLSFRGFGRLCHVLGGFGFGRLWEAFEQPWEALGDFGLSIVCLSPRLWEAWGNSGSLWEAVGSFGRLWET